MRYFLTITMLMLVGKIGFSQNHCTTFDELFRKRHKIANMTYGHPYTTFDRHNNKSFNETIDNIRKSIIFNDTIVRDAYQDIYSSANGGMPTDNGMEPNKTVSPLAVYAKNCAFVFLIGLDGNGNPLDTPGFTSARNAFREKQTYK